MSERFLSLPSDSFSQGIFFGVGNMCNGIVCVLLHATSRRCSNLVATCFTMTIKPILILIPVAKDARTDARTKTHQPTTTLQPQGTISKVLVHSAESFVLSSMAAQTPGSDVVHRT